MLLLPQALPIILIFIGVIILFVGLLISASYEACPILTIVIIMTLITGVPFLIYLRNDYKFVRVDYYEENGQMYAQKQHSQWSNMYEVWKNCNYTMEEFRQHVEYEVRHPFIKYFRREILFYQELPEYQNNVYKIKPRTPT